MSEKKKDEKNRWRNRTIAFRLSPEEEAELNERVKLMGYQIKQDYIVEAVLHNEVYAVGNPLMLLQFRRSLTHIESELSRISVASDMDEELLTPIRTILQIMEAFEKGVSIDQSRIVQRKIALEEKIRENREVPRVSDARIKRHIDIDNKNEKEDKN
ncbi:plasmid mobilization protein [Pseudobutyrivibrio sp. UC1225]|uniref:plasmid mobilization protein n=1 Tax=Pseudobutyrivibrio sp. UC1225 TaxID=1798185 RepID=UPI003FA7EACA